MNIEPCGVCGQPRYIEDENGYVDPCPHTVNCDSRCGAPLTPINLKDALLAVEHWKSHSYLHGCSHAN